ncbi:imidazole glycerol phosphate synthase subunit HisH [Halodesulfovibrio sp.]|jgi:glutamine amidotransferase|uniref:imidazole glycerol phosphate synthase subunit HisH n=1 Tax=Halodesulfovibrio sp. TaxID=1912772 RepID=UPI0025ED0DD2|nr:imidazole glycerol phosphate synthase subunit HisH [Halodesulfovibrio sp.]MCT4627655.1 imidazole glycerol phosphate synthase subunit HisH [Halodesulfovibrio sp.]
MLAILEYKAGNQTSVKRALDHLGIPNKITANPDEVLAAHGIIFPGVGAAGQAMEELLASGLESVLRTAIEQGKPLLGICVGCQIMLDYSQEGNTKTLGIIPGQCNLFNDEWKDMNGEPIRVPHMGWNKVIQHKPCELLKGISDEDEFYFVHSYFPEPHPDYVIATTQYGYEFCSIHGGSGLWAVQFHPEKSGRAGLRLMKNFYNYCEEAANAK